MAITDTFYDQRIQHPDKPVAKVLALSTHTEQTGTTVVGTEKFVANGKLVQLKTVAPNLTTDTDFTVTIKDTDGVAIFTSASIADNSTVITRVADDSAAYLCSGDNHTYQITLTFATSQTVPANAFKVLLYIVNH